MSLDKFITQILNIKEEDLEEITPIMQSDGSSIIKIRLKARSTICPYCDGKVKIHGYYTRMLKHAAFTNRKCIIVYQQRRYTPRYNKRLKQNVNYRDIRDLLFTTFPDLKQAYELKEYYTLLLNWSEEIINSFAVITGKRINNSYIESKNKLLEKILYNANGFTNFKRTRNRILYCLNKNDSYTL
jgi:transposase